jgi:capsule polysaccharide modification protein KpsS
MFADFKDKNVLLLQGPITPFFGRLSDELESLGANVTKVNLCVSESVLYGKINAIKYKGTLKDWPPYVEKLMANLKIHAVFLTGDMRPYHRCIKEISAKLQVDYYVFEEGYLRPNFITLEKGGVNGNSPISKDPDFYRRENLEPLDDVVPIGNVFRYGALYGIVYYVTNWVLGWRYPNYQHHRDTDGPKHAYSWIKSGVRKLVYKSRERGIIENLTGTLSKKYFLFPLQVHNDFQFVHSPYNTIEECMEEVISSFAQHAEKQHILVIKHHPADRPYREYGKYIKKLSRKYDLGNRIIYVHDLHLPTLLLQARGTVVMNSTVGLSSLYHQTPVKVLGTAVYDIPGMTYDGPLSEFWKNQGTVDIKLYRNFRGWIERHNQANGSFYKRLDGMKTGTGVRWF